MLTVNSMKKHNGFVLVVVLIFTLVMSGLSLISFRQHQLALKISLNHAQGLKAFYRAESSLKRAESYLFHWLGHNTLDQWNKVPGHFTQGPSLIAEQSQPVWVKLPTVNGTRETHQNDDHFYIAYLGKSIEKAPSPKQPKYTHYFCIFVRSWGDDTRTYQKLQGFYAYNRQTTTLTQTAWATL